MKGKFVGLQLYSIRDVLAAEPGKFETVMQQVKNMGYDGVELAGLYGLTPEYIRDTLKNIGLIPISAHVPLAEMTADLEAVIRTYQIIGCPFIVVPYLPEELRPNTPGYMPTLAQIEKIGMRVKAAGMQLLYHNHDFEFATLPDGRFALDHIYATISPAILQTELDTCWIKVAGQEPADYLKKYAGRCPVVHLKDFVKEGKPSNLYQLIGAQTEETIDNGGFFQFRAVGSGQQDWQTILDAVVDAGANWVIVEQDESYESSSMDCARESRTYLRTLGW